MSDSVERFSNRVENYVKYRPDYPHKIIGYLELNCGLTSKSVIADVGCGPGISSRLFLENGNRVIGVEPNAAMRSAAEVLLGNMDFWAIDGTSDQTTLADASVDMVVAAQAFHWFDAEKTSPEFKRILKPSGHIVLIWNLRQEDTTPFLIEYEQFIRDHSVDYHVVRHNNITEKEIGEFLGPDFRTAKFDNVQEFDFDGLLGRLASSSYMPPEGHEKYDSMAAELRILFAKHAENDRIKILYDTNVYHCQV